MINADRWRVLNNFAETKRKRADDRAKRREREREGGVEQQGNTDSKNICDRPSQETCVRGILIAEQEEGQKKKKTPQNTQVDDKLTEMHCGNGEEKKKKELDK